jgi:NAD(P)-dependent dehydrogenase (short-subunit alcohol dehydrogenase family)
MDLELTGRTAVVTGASRGIGLAVVRALQAEGVTVLGAARRATRELADTGAAMVEVDLGAPGGPRELISRAVAVLGDIDLLVNNVGGGDDLDLRGFLDLGDDDWAQAFELNLFAAVRVVREALPSLIERHGSIVNVSSIGAWRPEGPPLAYNIAKAALKALGRGLATEFGPRGVRVVTVSPGPVRTSMWEGPTGLGARLAQATGTPLEAVVAGAPDQVGMVTGRLAEPEEVASLVTYLLSGRAASITGSDHLIDGGAIRSA